MRLNKFAVIMDSQVPGVLGAPNGGIDFNDATHPFARFDPNDEHALSLSFNLYLCECRYLYLCMQRNLNKCCFDRTLVEGFYGIRPNYAHSQVQRSLT